MRKFIERYRQAPVFSTVYVIGSALSVASIMLVAIFLHVKTADIYPEHNRSELLHYGYMNIKLDDFGISNSGYMGAGTTADLAEVLDSLATVAVTTQWPAIRAFIGRERFDNIAVMRADQNIFSVYDYEFLEGMPFTADDVAADRPKAVITDRLARRLFGTDRDIVGRTVELDLKTQFNLGDKTWLSHNGVATRYGSGAYGYVDIFTITGVIREGSRLLNRSFAEVIVPPGEREDKYRPSGGVHIYVDGREMPIQSFMEKEYHYIGPYGAVVRPKPGVTASQIRAASDEWLRRVSSSEEIELDMGTWPRGELQLEFGDEEDSTEEFDASGVFSLYILLALVLLLVPALNLSSLISGNMDAKLGEMGVRKAFGAKRGTLLRECIHENLWLTGCGALLGLLLAWGAVMMWRDWLFVGASDSAGLSASQVLIDPAMLFAPSVFLAAVAVCYVLNLLSSIIPMWLALRKPVIDSIRVKS